MLLLLVADRIPKLATLLVPAAGSVLLIAAASGRDALQEGARTALARHQGNEMVLLTVVVCLGVGLPSVVATGLAERLPRGWRGLPGHGGPRRSLRSLA